MSLAYNYFCCIQIYQVLIINKHDYFINSIAYSQVDHKHNTKGVDREQLTLPLYRYVKCQRSFLFSGMKSWNEWPINLRNIETLRRYTIELRTYFCSIGSS